MDLVDRSPTAGHRSSRKIHTRFRRADADHVGRIPVPAATHVIRQNAQPSKAQFGSPARAAVGRLLWLDCVSGIHHPA